MEIFSETLKKLWNLWEIRSLVLLSLSLQIILIILGSRRKINNPHRLIGILLRAIVWCAYISADWVATVSLSIMVSNIADESSKAINSLQAFWAPFLLLHLGGPDTITAYSLEDNELWLRHLLGLFVEVVVAFNVFLRFWSSNALTILAIPVFTTGIVKYGERTWVLWSSSTQRFKDCLDLSPDHCLELFQYEMHSLVIKQEVDREDHNLVEAYYSYKRLKYLFANQIVNENKYHNYSIIKEKEAENAFKLVAIELALMYDVLYTKASIVYSRFGICLRCITFISSVSALVVFFIIIDKHSYPVPDVTVTYLLLLGAVLLEIYAFILLFSSDRTKLWLVKFKVAPHNHISTTLVNNFWRFANCLHSHLSNKKRWSASMGQYSLMNSVLKNRQRGLLGLDKLSCTSELLEKYQYLTWEDVNVNLQETIFNYLKARVDDLHKSRPLAKPFKKSLDELLSKSGEDVLKRYGYDDEEYDARIIIWHIVTDECYKFDLKNVDEDATKLDQNCRISKCLSDYMLYLLLFRPSMLPKGIGEIRYEHTYLHMERYYEAKPYKHKLRANKGMTSNIIPHSVFEQANNLASELKYEDDDEIADGSKEKWKMISEVWLEMLAYAAQNCEWKEHAQRLRQGGELLTHVSVLMVNFGLNKQVVSKGYS
ncbi:hypothetical protein Ddye_012842 [Dipteronia dyeriana]|uniref:DUF4220 domain-containing protein n=1 Tax=Dipteronia dyeriana TaxID=168575 RepID=A0AAD9X5B1_9ROSI|nr:hypothetical protein Ddye_012842 [Dipteronia dyeriana]